MALSEAPASNLCTLKKTVNHSSTIDLSNWVVLYISLPISLLLMPGIQVYSVALLKHFCLGVKEVEFSGRFSTGWVEGSVWGVWLDFQLSVYKLHFTFQLLCVPLDSRRVGWRGWGGGGARATGREGGKEEEGFGWRRVTFWVGARSWANMAMEISVVCLSFCQDGRGLEFGLGWGVLVQLDWGSEDLASCQPQQEAFASFTWTKNSSPGHCLAIWAQHSDHHPKKQELINVVHTGGGPHSQLHSMFIFSYVDKGRTQKQRGSLPDFSHFDSLIHLNSSNSFIIRKKAG